MRDVVHRIDLWLEEDQADDADQTLRDARREIIVLRGINDLLRDELADAKKWAMQERAIRWELQMLTDEERSAVQEVVDYLQPAGQKHQNQVAATLRRLLERLK